MRTMYIILASAGWIWLALVGSFLLYRLRRDASRPASHPTSESERTDS